MHHLSGHKQVGAKRERKSLSELTLPLVFLRLFQSLCQSSLKVLFRYTFLPTLLTFPRLPTFNSLHLLQFPFWVIASCQGTFRNGVGQVFRLLQWKHTGTGGRGGTEMPKIMQWTKQLCRKKKKTIPPTMLLVALLRNENYLQSETHNLGLNYGSLSGEFITVLFR